MPRTKTFDPQEALDRAMRVFWHKGYADTSMEDLVAGMGVSRYGIYSTFESKHQLYLAALDKYQREVASPYHADLLHPDAGLADIRTRFERMLAYAASPTGCWGCLVCNAAAEQAIHDPEVEHRVQHFIDGQTAGFRNALRNAQAGGDLPADRDVDALAHYLTGVVLGFSLYSKAGVPAETLRAYVETALDSLG